MGSGSRAACALAGALVVAIVVAGDVAHGEPGATPEAPRKAAPRDASERGHHARAGAPAACPAFEGLPELRTAWGGFRAGITTDAGDPGYAELFEFVSRSGGAVGRALVVRLASDDGKRAIYEGDIRRWAVIVVTEADGLTTVHYDFVDPERKAFFAHVAPGARQRREFTHALPRDLAPHARLCAVVGAVGHAERVEVIAHGRGRTRNRGELRDLLESPLRRRGR